MLRSPVNHEFGVALKQIWNTLRGLTGKTVEQIKDELLFEMQGAGIVRDRGKNSNPLNYWGIGHVPSDPRVVAFLAEVGVTRAHLSREWLERFVRASGYPKSTINEYTNILAGQNEPYLPPESTASTPFVVLPARWGSFLGRQTELESVLEVLNSRYPVGVIEGMPGIGKTTLALEVGYACAKEPRNAAKSLEWPTLDYIIWTTAETTPLGLNDLLDIIAHRLRHPELIQKPIKEKREMVNDLLAQLRVLLIVDGFSRITDPTVADFVVKVPSGITILLTSREKLQAPIFQRFPPARIPIGGLSEAEAYTFLRQQARQLKILRSNGTERARLEAVINASDITLEPLMKATERNPQALMLALGHIADRAVPLEKLVLDLYAAAPSVAKLFDLFFSEAWERCDQNARALWCVIPFFAVPPSEEPLKAAAGLQGRYFFDALERLSSLSLFDIEDKSDGKPRYRAHPLVRAFAGGKLREMPEFERQARARWVRYYLDYATSEILHGKPLEPYWRSLGGGGLTPIDPEWANLLNVLAWTDENRDDEALVDLTILLVHYMDRRALYRERLLYVERAAKAAHRLGRNRDEAWLHIDALGWSLADLDSFSQAKQEIMAGLQIAEHLGPEGGDPNDLIVLAYTFLARIHLYEEDMISADLVINRAMNIECQSVIRRRVLMIAGELAHKKQDYETAIGYYKKGLEIGSLYGSELENADDDMRQRLGEAYLAQGNLVQAEEEFEALINRQPRVGVGTLKIIYRLYGLARVAEAKGEREKAHQLASEAYNELAQLQIGHRLLRNIEDFLRRSGGA